MLNNVGNGLKFIQTDDKILDDIISKTREKSQVKEKEAKFTSLLEENLAEERRLLELVKKSSRKSNRTVTDGIALIPVYINMPRVADNSQIKLFTDKKNRCGRCGRMLTASDKKSEYNKNKEQALCPKCLTSNLNNFIDIDLDLL